MPETLDWVYYDSVSSGVTASADIVFFAQSESGTNKQTTNMPVVGKLSESEEMVIKEIGVFVETDTEFQDATKIYERAVAEFLINNNRVLMAPLFLFAPPQHISLDSPTLDQGALTSIGGMVGTAFILKYPIKLLMGSSFKLVVRVGETQAGTASDLKAYIRGLLTRK